MLEEQQSLKIARLLLVENDPATGRAIERILWPHVGQILSASNGEQALELWEEADPDVVLTEVHVDGLDGLSLSERIKAADPDASIIVISSSSDSSHLRRAIEIGVDDYVFKPVDPLLLLDAVFRSVRDRRRVRDLQLARMVFEVANEGVLITDENTVVVAVNPAFSEITGYRPDEIIGNRVSMLASGVHSKDFYRTMWETLLTHGRWSGEIVNRRKNGSLFPEWLSIAAVQHGGGLPTRYVGLFSDISERKKEEERIRRLAHFDSLTGLANRVLFNDRLQRSLARARRYRHSLALVYVDLDRFKAINDTRGHAAGDHVLQTVASRLLAALRQSDTVGRRGGDEFVAVLELNDHPEGLLSVCQKLLAELSEPIRFGGMDIPIGASLGVAVFPNDGEEAEELLAAADTALYEAKARGRGTFCFFRSGAQPGISDRHELERQLRDGLHQWSYALHYLPEISVATGKVERLEALLRFSHPEHGLMEAGRFLEVAEEIGIMPELGQRALAQAVAEMSGVEASPGLVVDLSARQLSAPGMAARLVAMLEKAGMPASRITFECTEAALTGNDSAVQTVYELAAAGCHFTLDDFGAGFCSFSLLSQLPMTSIKIDRSFIRDIEICPQIRELVAALIAFGRRLKLRTVAEGVETGRQFDFLREAGCDAVQGYLFGKPMAFDALRCYLAAPPSPVAAGESSDSGS